MLGIARWLLGLMGYDREAVKQLALRDLISLTTSALLCLLSALLFAFSAGYLAYIGVYADNGRLPTAIVVGLGVFVFAVTMQLLFVTNGGYSHQWSQGQVAGWRPDRLRLVCVFVIASLLSIPYILFFNRNNLDKKIEEIRQTKVAYYRDQLGREHKARHEAVIRNRTLVVESERMVTAGITGAKPLPQRSPDFASSRRKALVIGAQHYQHSSALPGVATDIRMLKRSLIASGFTTIESFDEPGDALLLRIDTYLKSLRPGDVSVVYYGGHAFQQAGRNFMVPIDYQREQRPSTYKFTQLVDEIARTRPALSLVVIDAPHRFTGSLGPAGLAPMRVAPHTAIVLATPPGEVQPDKIATDSLLAAALALQVTRAEDLHLMLDRIVAEVLTSSQRQTGWIQHVTVVARRSENLQVAVPVQAKAVMHTSASPDAALTQGTGCPPSTGVLLQRCLRARLRMLDWNLETLQKQDKEDDERNVIRFRDSLDRSSMLRERWLLQWSDQKASILAAVVAILFMMLGDLLRDVWVAPLRRYERLRASGARQSIESEYAQARKTVSGALARYPSSPLPGIRWHERPQYFEASSAAWLSLGGIVAGKSGSDAELRQVLSLPLLPAPGPIAPTDSN